MHHQALIEEIGGAAPILHEKAFAAPTSVILGAVVLERDVSVWYQAVLRADANLIVVGAGSNIQDNCTIHADPDHPVLIGERVSVGHNAVVHGCTVEDGVLIGIGATVLNGAHIGQGALVAANAMVPQEMKIPPNTLVTGSPARIRRTLTTDEKEFVGSIATAYLDLTSRHKSKFKRPAGP